MTIVRWTNIVCGALLLAGAVTLILFMAGVIAAPAGEPGSVTWGVFWTVAFVLIAILCFVNAVNKVRRLRSDRLVALNAAVAIALTLLFWLVTGDAVTAWVVVICAIGPLAALFGGLFGPQAKRSGR